MLRLSMGPVPGEFHMRDVEGLVVASLGSGSALCMSQASRLALTQCPRTRESLRAKVDRHTFLRLQAYVPILEKNKDTRG